MTILQKCELQNLDPQSLLIQIEQIISRTDQVCQHLQTPGEHGLELRTLAHELRNLLTPVLGHVQLARRRSDDSASVERSLEKAVASIRLVKSLLDTVLSTPVSPLRPQRNDGHTEQIDLADAVAAAIDSIDHPAFNERVLVTAEVEGEQAFLSRLRLHQVLVNVLRNAYRATAGCPSPEVNITAKRYGEFIRLAVRDNGPGVPVEVIPTLFHSAGRSGAAAGGSGLGLSICRKILEEAGGAIEVDPTLNDGACFYLYLPAADPRSARQCA